MITAPRLIRSRLLAFSLLVACALFAAGCPKQRDGGASAEAAASARSASAAPQPEERGDEKARDEEDEDEKEDGKKDKGGW